jgi:hypothetical protein
MCSELLLCLECNEDDKLRLYVLHCIKNSHFQLLMFHH